MAHLHQSAGSPGITRLFAYVSLTAEPFFSQSGFAVEAPQRVEARCVVRASVRMVEFLSAHS